ncbi:hypothetical protein HZS_5266, partial [Henneguya salminicola]
ICSIFFIFSSSIIAFKLKNQKFIYLDCGFPILSYILALTWCIYPMVYKNQSNVLRFLFHSAQKEELKIVAMFISSKLLINDYKDYANVALHISRYSNFYSFLQETSPQSQLYQTGYENSIMKCGKRIVMTIISMIILSAIFTISNLILINYKQSIKKISIKNDEFLICNENIAQDDVHCIDAHDIS